MTNKLHSPKEGQGTIICKQKALMFKIFHDKSLKKCKKKKYSSALFSQTPAQISEEMHFSNVN